MKSFAMTCWRRYCTHLEKPLNRLDYPRVCEFVPICCYDGSLANVRLVLVRRQNLEFFDLSHKALLTQQKALLPWGEILIGRQWVMRGVGSIVLGGNAIVTIDQHFGANCVPTRNGWYFKGCYGLPRLRTFLKVIAQTLVSLIDS